MLSNLKDESLFTSLRSDAYSQAATPTKFGKFPRSPREEHIKKRVVSQLSSNRTPKLKQYTGLPDRLSTRACSNPRDGGKRSKQSETDFISLNRRISLLSRTMGKEANMGASSSRRHEIIAGQAFPLTAVKDDKSIVGGPGSQATTPLDLNLV